MRNKSTVTNRRGGGGGGGRPESPLELHSFQDSNSTLTQLNTSKITSQSGRLMEGQSSVGPSGKGPLVF